jgi:tetratricopeptide (TPR) repeat protein
MAFGFGFNKQKTLSSAEKYVQQGKIQNAIAEYEKVTKADPKDLTVTNTIGDLYSRLGEADKATECFKTVGDAYAAQGFTVKAIAMYKKISKLKPSLECVLKLAELYTQQGLFNDARAQYLQVAEEFLKSGELDNAVRIFQKILEMDPENTTMRIRLAEVYVRLGKKTEAWQIFSATAETLRSKGSLSGAEDVLQRMLTLDPGSSYALLMQGRNLLEAGDSDAAIEALKKVPDLDSNPDGLRDLLKGYLKSGRLSDAGALAGKLLAIHNDLASISAFADALMQAGQYENALQVYDQHADRLLAEDSDKVLRNLHTIIGHVRDNPASLEKLLELFQKAGESTHLTEVIELLAHASVQSGDLPRARDLYHKLASMEPGNPLHMNNYQQVVGQMGGPPAEKLISAEEAAVIVDELEASSPSLHQHYPDAIALAIRSALTDAELFISYNMPGKALGPLMTALPQAPNDLRLNQRLAALHTRAARFGEAGICCRTLQSVYSEADYPEEATRYGELADRYEQRSAALAVDVEPELPSVEEEEAPEEMPVAAAPWPSAPVLAAAPDDDPEFSVVGDQETQAPQADPVHAAAPEAEAASEEIDLSSEWDDSLTIEADAPAEAPEFSVGETQEHPPAAAHLDPEKAAEAIEEIRFYLEHGMPEQATSAFEKLQAVTDDEATLEAFRTEIAAASPPLPAVEEITPVEDISEFSTDEMPAAEVEAEAVAAEPAVVEEVAELPVVEETPIEEMVAEEASVEDLPAEEVAAELPVMEAVAEPQTAEFAIGEPPAIEESLVAETIVEEPIVEETSVEHAIVEHAIAEPSAVEEPVPDIVVAQARALAVKPAALKAPVPPPVVQPAVEPVAEPTVEPPPAPGVLDALVSDLESSLGEGFLPQAFAPEVDPPYEFASSETARPNPSTQLELEPVHNAAPTAFGGTDKEVLGELVADLEASIPPDFLKDAPVAESAAAPAPTPAPVPPPQVQPVAAAPALPTPATMPLPAPPVSVPVVASAAAASSGGSSVSHHAPVAHDAAPLTFVPPPPISPIIPSAPAVKSSPFALDASVDLAEMFGELRQDLEAGSAGNDEDPETHYNLGIAFREMGLLDEAIGELQKTCQAVDRGHPFGQMMQTYTWLAQCFLDKGVPQAAIRWYHKALEFPGVDEETRTALHYELASAYEASGDKPASLKHFMEVYGRNIDYRDVAERIKPLKS